MPFSSATGMARAVASGRKAFVFSCRHPLERQITTAARRRFEPALGANEFAGGRAWWAHLAFDPMNIQLTISNNQIEESSS
jgi:hypothetical protein